MDEGGWANFLGDEEDADDEEDEEEAESEFEPSEEDPSSEEFDSDSEEVDEDEEDSDEDSGYSDEEDEGEDWDELERKAKVSDSTKAREDAEYARKVARQREAELYGGRAAKKQKRHR